MRRLLGVSAAAAFAALAGCQPPPSTLTEHDYPVWGFKASFPSQPAEVTKAGAADGSLPPMFTVDASSPMRDFSVSAADVSQANETLDQLASNAAAHVSSGLGEEPGIPSYAATSERVDGLEYTLTKNGKWAGVMEVFLANGKFYEVLAHSTQGQDDPSVNAFITSFHIVATGPSVAKPANTSAPAGTQPSAMP